MSKKKANGVRQDWLFVFKDDGKMPCGSVGKSITTGRGGMAGGGI